MRKTILAIAVTGVASIAHAKDVYLYDLLKEPAYARSWATLLDSSKAVPAWVRDDNRYVATPAKTVSIDALDYSISVIAKQHATEDGQAAVMFNPDGSRAWAEIQDAGEPKRLLGGPSPAQRAALDKALSE